MSNPQNLGDVLGACKTTLDLLYVNEASYKDYFLNAISVSDLQVATKSQLTSQIDALISPLYAAQTGVLLPGGVALFVDGLLGASAAQFTKLDSAIQSIINQKYLPLITATPTMTVEQAQAQFLSQNANFYKVGEAAKVANILGNTIGFVAIASAAYNVFSAPNADAAQKELIANGTAVSYGYLFSLAFGVFTPPGMAAAIGTIGGFIIGQLVRNNWDFIKSQIESDVAGGMALIDAVSDISHEMMTELGDMLDYTGQGAINFLDSVLDWGTDRLADFQQFRADYLGADVYIPGTYTPEVKSDFARMQTDPIILDLDGNGVQLTHIDASNAQFDLHNSGFAVDTGWIGAGDAFLARDLNSNGSIDNITELFGDSTTGGFAMLKALDSNNDNKITSADTAWSTLRLWQDADGDGSTDAGELQTLAARNVTEVSLNSTPVDVLVNGNLIADVATFKRSDNSTGEVAEAYFDNSRMNSTFTGSYTLNPEVLLLPDARGYGTVPDLFIAMSLDNTLLNMVKTLANTPLLEITSPLGEQVEAILMRWAGVEGVSPTGRGAYVNGQHLAVVEKFVGQDYLGVLNGVSSANPANAFRGNALEQAYQQILQAVETRLLMQGPLASFVPNLKFDYATDALVGSTDFSSVFTAAGALTPTDDIAAANYWTGVIPKLISLADSLGVARSSYEAALQQAFANAGLADSAAAITANNVVIGGDTGFTHYGQYYSPPSFVISGDGSDTLYGGSGNDVIHGGAGNDIIATGAGTNKIYAGTGNDTVYASGYSDLIDTGSGDDQILYDDGYWINFGASNLNGGTGYDTLKVYRDNVSAFTITGIEKLVITANVTLTGAQLAGFSAIDVPVAYPGAYTAAEIFAASSGTYDLSGKTITQIVNLVGTDGNDTLIAGSTTTSLKGWEGNDTLRGGDAINGVDYRAGVGTNIIEAGSGNDTIVVEGFSDQVSAGAGNDRIIFNDGYWTNFGAGTLNGGADYDTLEVYRDRLQSFTITNIEKLIIDANVTLNGTQLSGFSAVTANGVYGAEILAGSAGTYDLSNKSVTNIVNLVGSDGNDTLIAGTTTLRLTGWEGNDTLQAGTATGGVDYRAGIGTNIIQAGSGSDTIVVEGSSDQVTAGAGDDRIIFNDGYYINFGAGSLNGEAGNDTLEVYRDNLSSFTISGIENLKITANVTLTASQVAGFSAVAAVGAYPAEIFAASAGTYDLSGKVMTQIVNLVGSSGADTLVAGSATTRLVGNEGNDILKSNAVGGREYYGGDGTDTLDLSGVSGALLINISSASRILNGVTVAANKIQLVNGGTDNIGGIEKVIGGSGDDYFAGTSGNDNFDGGAGGDTVDYSNATASIRINLSNATKTLGGIAVAARTGLDGLGGTDTLTNIEHITGSTYDDYIYGSEYSNLIIGNNGNDTMIGNFATDRFWGGQGNDVLNDDFWQSDTVVYLDSPNDIFINLDEASKTVNNVTLNATTGLDGFGTTDSVTGIDNIEGTQLASSNIFGNSHNNTITTFDGNDWVNGGYGDDIIMTGAGNDYLYDHKGADVYDGGSGIDTLRCTISNGVRANLDAVSHTLNGYSMAAGTMWDGHTAGGSIDTVSNVENLLTSNYDDYVFGSAVANEIKTQSGNDWINGGGGDDVLYGGAGSDKFVFGVAQGNDTVMDFTNGEDLFDLTAFATNYASLALTTVGADVRIQISGAPSDLNVLVKNTTLAALDAGDFVFV